MENSDDKSERIFKKYSLSHDDEKFILLVLKGGLILKNDNRKIRK